MIKLPKLVGIVSFDNGTENLLKQIQNIKPDRREFESEGDVDWKGGRREITREFYDNTSPKCAIQTISVVKRNWSRYRINISYMTPYIESYQKFLHIFNEDGSEDRIRID